ncbi:hypothetical protein NLJ89_g2721 [Agrocybe chaxingu]|uniref:PPM-type phosphatase domain-containing protein n=1 Tax=Agrocybe chaxingu TaxID=84603 RepID=A0A9W8K625_9AGAR|nr:hypothetical protein NLJ89_g2721 [Agrocybe chaxingu]
MKLTNGRNPDLILLGVGVGLLISLVVMPKKQLPGEDSEEELKAELRNTLLCITQYMPFDSFDKASHVLSKTAQLDQHGVLRLDRLTLKSGQLGSILSDGLASTWNDKALPIFLTGIYQGHKGSSIAEMLEKFLLVQVVARLQLCYHELPAPTPENVHAAIQAAFEYQDMKCLYTQLRDVMGYGVLPKTATAQTKHSIAQAFADTYSSATALVGVYFKDDRIFYVARTGGGRAVLGRRVAGAENPTQHRYEVHVLAQPESSDDNRVFGDSSRKWPKEAQELVHKKFLGPSPSEKSPATPTPTVSHFTGIQRGDFVVLASEGFWESLGSEEVVGLVGQWLEQRGMRERVGEHEVILPPSAENPTEFVVACSMLRETTFLPSELPVVFPAGYEDRTTKYKSWNVEKRFISVPHDQNAASHLMRNALGGADRDVTEALYQIGGQRGMELRVAEINYHYMSNSKIRYRGQETKSDKFFRKEGWSWNGRGRVFTGADGKEYVWKMKDENCVLYWKGNKETPAATYHPPQPAVFGKGRPGSLEIHSEAMYMCDLVIMTFVYIEKFRQDRLEENSFAGDAIADSAGG